MARKEKQFHFIYKTTNLINGKYYIGMHSTDNLSDGYYGSGRRLKRSLNKYGKENHKLEIIEFLPNRQDLKIREKEIVNLQEISKDICMNLQIGGGGGFIDENHINKCHAGASKWIKKQWEDDLYKKKMSKASSESMKLKHQLKKIKYNTFTGKSHTIETKEKMKKSKSGFGIGENNSQFGTCWITKDGINKKIKKDYIDDYIILGWEKGRK